MDNQPKNKERQKLDQIKASCDDVAIELKYFATRDVPAADVALDIYKSIYDAKDPLKPGEDNIWDKGKNRSAGC